MQISRNLHARLRRAARIGMCCVAVISWAVCVPALLAREAVRPIESPLPGCGPGAVYAMLRLLNKEVRIEEVESAFESAGLPTSIDSRHSVADLAAVLRRFGVPIAIVESKRANLQLPRLPAILHLDPRCKPCDPDHPGHFVVLHSVHEDQARIVDVTSTSGGYAQSADQLLKRWRGVALVPLPPQELRSEQLWSRIAGVLASAQAGLVVVLARRALRRPKSARTEQPQPS